jgi:hypothetical protein
MGDELELADGQMDRDVTQLIAAFRNFANAPKIFSRLKIKLLMVTMETLMKRRNIFGTNREDYPQ